MMLRGCPLPRDPIEVGTCQVQSQMHSSVILFGHLVRRSSPIPINAKDGIFGGSFLFVETKVSCVRCVLPLLESFIGRLIYALS